MATPFDFNKSSTGISFSMSPWRSRNNYNFGTRMAQCVTVWPYEGLGNNINAAFTFSPPGIVMINPGSEIDPDPANYSSPQPYQWTDYSYTYQKVTSRIDWSTGEWSQTVIEYYTYFINGYANSTKIKTNTRSSPYKTFSVIGFLNTNTQSKTATTYTINAAWSSGDSATYTMTISKTLLYSDVLVSSLDAINANTTPAFGALNPSFPKALSMSQKTVYPNSTSTTATITEPTPWYRCYASVGRLFLGSASGSSSGIYGGTVANLSNSYPFPVIISNKSRVYFSKYDALGLSLGNKPCPPYNIYGIQLDPASSYAPSAVYNTGFTAAVGSTVNFTPIYTASSLPPYPFSGPYSAPYNPGGYGELGYLSTAI